MQRMVQLFRPSSALSFALTFSVLVTLDATLPLVSIMIHERPSFLRAQEKRHDTRRSVFVAGVAGLEPTNARFRVWCLTNLAIPLHGILTYLLYAPAGNLSRKIFPAGAFFIANKCPSPRDKQMRRDNNGRRFLWEGDVRAPDFGSGYKKTPPEDCGSFSGAFRWRSGSCRSGRSGSGGDGGRGRRPAGSRRCGRNRRR